MQPVGNIATYPGYSKGSKTGGGGSVASSIPSVTGTPTLWDALPNATMPTFNFEPTPEYLYPLANGSRQDCLEYTDNSLGDVSCDYINAGVDISDFFAWNPSLNPYNCILSNETRYCTLRGIGYANFNSTSKASYAEVPSNAAPNSTTNCYEWYSIQTGKYLPIPRSI